MELKIKRETIPVSECIYDGVQEQNIGLDYILPDYYPDIFRLVHCETVPVITDYSVSGSKLTYELRCDMRILYCGDSSSVLQCVTQQQTYTKTVELDRACDKADVALSPKTDHVNFRALNKRRLDLRGTVSVKICVTCDKESEVISDAEGMNIQLRRVPVSFASVKVSSDKTIQLTDDTELNAAQPDILSIVSCRCTLADCECKLISGKLLAKGNVKISLLYSCETDGEGQLEPMEFTVPYSQIIDVTDIDDTFSISVTPEVISCEITPSADKNGANRILRCELEMRLGCRAVKTASVMLAQDAFSTVYPCDVLSTEISAQQLPDVTSESFHCTAKLAEGDDMPQKVYAVRCTPKNINTRLSDDGGAVTVSGMLTYSTAVRDAGGMISMPERDEAFEQEILLDKKAAEDSTITAEIKVKDVSYNISDNGTLTAKADITADISVSSASRIKVLTDIAADDSVKKQRDGDYAIKLYFGVENEDVWEIAKRYSTSVEAVMEENELSGDKLGEGGMLLIPIVL